MFENVGFLAGGARKAQFSSSSSSSSLGSRCVPWLGEGLSMLSPNYPVLCFPLPYRVAPVFVQVVSPSLGWSPLSSFLVIWSPTGDTRGHQLVIVFVNEADIIERNALAECLFDSQFSALNEYEFNLFLDTLAKKSDVITQSVFCDEKHQSGIRKIPRDTKKNSLSKDSSLSSEDES